MPKLGQHRSGPLQLELFSHSLWSVCIYRAETSIEKWFQGKLAHRYPCEREHRVIRVRWKREGKKRIVGVERGEKTSTAIEMKSALTSSRKAGRISYAESNSCHPFPTPSSPPLMNMTTGDDAQIFQLEIYFSRATGTRTMVQASWPFTSDSIKRGLLASCFVSEPLSHGHRSIGLSSLGQVTFDLIFRSICFSGYSQSLVAGFETSQKSRWINL